MKLVLIRHADPDYDKDSLTEKGFVEAKLLSEKVAKMEVNEFFVSPLGRAKVTASFSLEKHNATATELDWLQEFRGRCIRPDKNKEMICWDWLPEDWTTQPIFYDKDKWFDSDYFKNTNVKEEYKYVCSSLDKFLEEHGYKRTGNYYSAVKPNNDTIVLFCHYGVTVVILSHLLGISPMPLWHGLVAAPSSITTIATEERRDGKASFRVSSYGDISHLYVANEPPAFAARFCECFANEDERHD